MRLLPVFLAAVSGLTSQTFAADIPLTDVPAADFGTVEELRQTRADWTGFNGVLFFGGGFLTGSDSLGLDAFFRSGAGGGSVGYDHQFNSIVLGASLEGAITNFQSSTRSGSARQSANWLSAATVRVGYDAGRFMPYLSAGVGLGNYKIERKSDGASSENTHVAFVAGGGVEARITDNIFARADYKHYEFSEETYDVPGWSSFSADGRADMFTLGAGYRF